MQTTPHRMGKTIIVVGLVIVVIGLIIYFSDRIPLVGRLPGDIVIKRESFSLYFPLGTCILLSIVISIVISIVLYLIRRFS